MANRLYNKQVTPKGYKRGGIIKRTLGNIRKKIVPTFGKTSEKIKKFVGA